MSKSGKNNSVRIIGGNWRGRRLPVADVPGLRPSGDRCRETLFNWLQPWIPAADCGDLFAGTGALGFEAASRGAASVLMIEKHPRVQEVLSQGIEQLQAVQVNLLRSGAMSMIDIRYPLRKTGECGVISSWVMFVCSFFEDKCMKTKETSRMAGLISEDRHPPPPVFSPCIKAGITAGLFLSSL